MSIQPLWLTYFIEILLVLEFQLTKAYFGTFYYKAHFRPQISSNAVILLLYVADLFLTGNEKQIVECKKKLGIWDERPWVNALFPRSGGMAELRRNLSQLGKVCSGNLEKIWYVGM